MTFRLQADSVSIRRVGARISATGFDPLAARIELQRLLGALDWSIPWLPPSAVLCIKHLPDPQPGTLRLNSGDLRPAAAWQRALLAIVEDKVRRAVRPAFGAVPADAEAVVFADRGELIACLALDWCEGLMASRWWWRALFGPGALERAVVEALLEAPEYLPPVVQRLVQAGRVREFAAQLSSAEIEDLTSVLLARYGLEPLRPTSLTSTTRACPTTTQERLPPAAAISSGGPSGQRMAVQPSAPPWRAWLDERELEALSSTAKMLVGIALSLQRAPSAARSSEFARALLAYEDSRTKVPPPVETTEVLPRALAETASAEIAGTPGATRARAEQTPRLVATASATKAPASIAVSTTEQPLAVPAEQGQHSVEPTAVPAEPTRWEAELVPRPTTSASPPSVGAINQLPDPVSSIADEAPREPRLAEPPTSPSESLESLLRVYGAPVKTQLGGLFFLTNLALVLELYPDFTRPREHGLSLPIWDFISLVGERVLDRPLQDPIWELLQRLAPRIDAQPLTAPFTVPSGWQLPAGWASAAAATPPKAPYSLATWLDWLMPPIKARLCRGLGLVAETELASVLLLHPARVHVSDSHVDVKLALADLPIAVRQSGLDRNPGFLPSTGHFLAFHFD